MEDASVRIWGSRRHLKNFGAEIVDLAGEPHDREKHMSYFVWATRELNWWITIINFIGCVAFLLSAFMAFVRPQPISDNLATWATVFTLIGALSFFTGAYLMWPEMSRER